MKNSKLIQVLKSFSVEEMKEFEKYLNSPFFGCSPFILNFFMELKKYYPEFNEEHIRKETIYSKLYKGKRFSDTNINRITSSLMRMSLDFMAIKHFRKTEAFYDFCLLQDLRIRKLFPIIETESRNIRKKKEQNKKTHAGSFLGEFLFISEIINYKIDNNLLKTSSKDIEYQGNCLLALFLTYSTNIFYYKDLHKERFNYDIKCLLTENFSTNFEYANFIKSLEDNNTDDAKFLRINYYYQQIFLNVDTEKNYLILKDLWINSGEYLGEHLRRAHYAFLVNFCQSQIRNSNSKYFRELFDLLQINLKDKLFLINSNTMSVYEYKHIVNVSISVKEYAWLEDFIKSYSKYLIPEFRESMVHFSYSSLDFEKGDFEKSLERLSKIKQESDSFKMFLKELLLKIYYELNHAESAYSLLDSSKHFLNNTDKIILSRITDSKNFMKYYGRLLKIRVAKEINGIEEIELDVEKEIHINNKLWLLDKIKDLKNKK